VTPQARGARATAAAPAQPARQPARRQAEGARSPLRVVDPRRLRIRARQRRARVLVAAAAAMVLGSLGVVAAGQALVTSQQVRVDNLHQALSAAVAQDQDLQLSRAQLAAPSRILSIAEHELHMVAPASVTYLVPVNPGPPESVPATAGARHTAKTTRGGSNR